MPYISHCVSGAIAEEVEAEESVVAAGTLAGILQEGLRRLQEQDTWKVWQWPADGQTCFDAESFRWDKGHAIS